MGSSNWRVRLTAVAQQDFRDILRWTTEKFGVNQARTYAETLSLALEDLCAGPGILGAKARNEIGLAIYSLHVTRKRRKGRHFVMFQVGNVDGENVIDVLRILHDSMDIARHLSADDLH